MPPAQKPEGRSQPASREFDPVAFAEKLEYSPEIEALGISQEDAQALGIGGDLISLWGHIQKCSLADAGRQIADTFRIGTVTGRTSNTVPDHPPAPTQTGLKALDYLEPTHPSVEAAGFDPEEAAKLGIGYASKGLMRGTVAVPIRDEHGTLLGYIGVQEARCPPKGFFPTNVVPLTKKTA